MSDLTMWPNAEAIKDALRARHPARAEGSYVGQWTCLEEWARIDLVALDAWADAEVVGYEVKVSRSDLRAELLQPFKRAEAVSRTTRFYFAVPEGLLTPDELAFQEPDWTIEDFERAPCPGVESRVRATGWTVRRFGGRCENPRVNRRTGQRRRSRWVSKSVPKGYTVLMPVPVVFSNTGGYEHEGEWRYHPPHESQVEGEGYRRVTCPTCGGTGYQEKSLVEREWPMLWVPKDVGLIVVRSSGDSVIVRHSPRRKAPLRSIAGYDLPEEEELNRRQRQAINDLARWASNRPDMRHR